MRSIIAALLLLTTPTFATEKPIPAEILISTGVENCNLRSSNHEAAIYALGMIQGVIPPAEYVKLITRLNPAWTATAAAFAKACWGEES